jgi:membrane glycosyltransferase
MSRRKKVNRMDFWTGIQDELMKAPMWLLALVTGLGGLAIVAQGLLIKRAQRKKDKDIQP